MSELLNQEKQSDQESTFVYLLLHKLKEDLIYIRIRIRKRINRINAYKRNKKYFCYMK